MSARPVRIGIIGCGNVLSAYRAAIDKLRLRGLAEPVLLCGREAQRASASALFAGRDAAPPSSARFVGRDAAPSASGPFATPRFITDSDAVINSSDVDLVLILTSMSEHARLARAALEAGKHVLVEKPLATSLADAAELLALAKRSRGRLICAPFTILSPTFQTVARRIRNGDIGKPCSARARYGWSGPWWSEWFYRAGGGCLFDLGVYCITSLTGLLGPAKRVMAMTGAAIPEREVNGRKIRVDTDDNAQVLLDFGGSTFAVVTSGFTMQQYRSPALEVYGATGTIQILGDDWAPEGYELWQNSVGAWQLFKETAPEWRWTDGLNHLVECIHSGAPPLVTPEHAFHVLEIMIKAQQSSREGRAMEIQSEFPPPAFGQQAAGPAHLAHDRTREHS